MSEETQKKDAGAGEGSTKDSDVTVDATKLQEELGSLKQEMSGLKAQNELLKEQNQKLDMYDPELIKGLMDEEEPKAEPEEKIDWENISVKDASAKTLEAVSRQFAQMEKRIDEKLNQLGEVQSKKEASAEVDKLLGDHKDLKVGDETYNAILQLSKSNPGATLEQYYQLATRPNLEAKLGELEKRAQERKSLDEKRAAISNPGSVSSDKLVPNLEKYKDSKEGIIDMCRDMGL